MVFKGNRGGSNLRSSKTDDFNLVSVGENGTSVRAGKFPEDFIYPSACLNGDCPNDGPNPNTLYRTTFNNNVNTTYRLGDITVDRRNNEMYLCYAILGTHPRSKLFASDVEPVVVAMEVNGKLKWWNRLHQESKDEGSPAAQELDGLALDYSSNQLFVAGYSLDTCRFNFWKGNEITLKPGGNGFQNQFTGQNSSIKTAWLGKMNLSDGKMKAATYVGEYANNIGQAGAIFSDPLLNGWPSPNTGNANLANTRIRGIEVAPNGDVLIRGEATRTITTSNAYQRIPKPSQGLAPVNQFVRVYNSGLDSVKYSSAIGLIYEPNTATPASNLSIQATALTQEGIVIAGFSNNSSGKLGVINVPTFGDSLCSRKMAVLGRLTPFCDTIETPTIITGAPAITCAGSTYTLSTPASAGNVFVWSYPRGWVGSDSVFSSNTATITLKVNTGAPGGNLSVVKKSACGLSLPFGLTMNRPLTTSISITLNPSATAATYNQPSGSAFWFINGDTARRSTTLLPIRTSTIIFAQVTPVITPGTSITARITNDCGTFNSNFIITSLQDKILSEKLVELYPNPAQSEINIEMADRLPINSVELIDQMGRIIKVKASETGNGGQKIQIKELSHGIYILKINTDGGVIRKRFVKN